MFGFAGKRAKAVDEVELYVRSMFAGLGDEDGPLPEAVFADPYVTGFLQVLTVHAVANVYRWRLPGEAAVTGIMLEALDRLGPGYGAAARKGLASIGYTAHPLHESHLAGRELGADHVATLFVHDGIARNEPHHSFREYVRKRYL